MADLPLTTNLVQVCRRQRGWSQQELARRAGISRAAVSAIETDRLVPSVAAALALAAAFGCAVEDLFGLAAGRPEPAWAWPPPHTPCRYWQADVGGRRLYLPVEAVPAGGPPHDGLFRNGEFAPSGTADPAATLVLACCDPAVHLLAAEFARATGCRLLPLPRPSGQALALLGRGLVHVAGVHFASRADPDGNRRAVREAVGPGYRLLRVAGWQEGLSVAPSAGVSSVRAALRPGLRWVGREPGSAARRCLDELRPDRPPPRRLARDHHGVAEAVRCGWADVGVCHRLAAEDAGLRFFAVREEGFDLCFPAGADGDPLVGGLLRVVRSPSYRRLLGELPGYETAGAGDLQDVS